MLNEGINEAVVPAACCIQELPARVWQGSLPILVRVAPCGLGMLRANSLTMGGTCGPIANVPWLMDGYYCASSLAFILLESLVHFVRAGRRLPLPSSHINLTPPLRNL